VGNIKGLVPVNIGGGQEFGLRSGTENVPSIVGFTEAMKFADAIRLKESARIKSIIKEFVRLLSGGFLGAKLNYIASPGNMSLPNMVNVCFSGCPSDEMLSYLDMQGVAVSTGSACSARSPEPSRVLLSLGYSNERARQSIRFSFGRETTLKEVKEIAKILKGFRK
jgi:cysteine desulfurase